MSDIYNLGKCECGHLAHNHGLGMCVGNLLCGCSKFTGWGYESATFLAALKGETE